MPWCQPCARFYSPNSMTSPGDCPACGTHLAEPADVAPSPELRDRRTARALAPAVDRADIDRDGAAARVPWHFWLLLAMAAIYLGWRALQGILLLF